MNVATTNVETDLIEGISLLRVNDRHDDAWAAPYFEQGHNIPFSCKRVFYIRTDGEQVDRGGHANSCDELIVAIAGSVLIEVDNGAQTCGVRLTSPENALWIRAGLLIHLRELMPQTLLMVLASQSYADTRHFDRPQPHLLTKSGSP